MRKVRGKCNKTLLKERSRASSVGALNNFIKRKRISDEDSVGEGKREKKRMLTHHHRYKKKIKMKIKTKPGKKG